MAKKRGNPNRNPDTGQFESAEQASKRLVDNLGQANDIFQDINMVGEESAIIFQDIAKGIAATAKDSKEFKTEIGAAGKLQKELAKDAEFLATVNEKVLTDKAKIAQFEKRRERLQANQIKKENLIRILQTRRVNAGKEEAEYLDRTIENLQNGGDYAATIADKYQQIAETNEKIDKKTKWIDGLADFAGDIPLVGKFFKDFEKSAVAAREAGAKGGNVLAAGMFGVASAAGKLLTVFAGATFIKGLNKADQDVTDLSRNLNITRERAHELNNAFNEAGIATKGLTGNELRDALSAVSENLGITADLSIESASAIGVMTKKLGLSGQEAATLAKFSAATGQNVEDVQKNLIGTVAIQNANNDTAIRYQDVMKDIAGTSATTRLSVSRMPGGLAKAAFEARKLGLSFDKMEGIAGNLLDYESSIAAEMEAELLTGRNLELNGARMAALRNDMTGMAQELAKNNITAEKFGNMNRIQQEAIAKAMGMSRDDMGEMLENQEALKKFSDTGAGSLNEAVKIRQKEIQALKDKGDLEGAAIKEKQLMNDLGDSEIKRQLENKSLAEAQKEAMQDMTAAVSNLAIVLQPITKFFSTISTVAAETFVFITKMGSKLKALGNFAGDFSKHMKQVSLFIARGGKGITTLFKAFGSGMKIAGKGGIKSLLKKIPILGALVGIGFAAKRAMDGDWLGAGLEFLSGVASIFPGIGTAVSVGLDAGLMGLDMAGVTGSNSQAVKDKKAKSKMDVGDFEIRALPQDTIITQGGTKLGGRTEQLLEQLIRTIEKQPSSGTVNLDGRAVGEVMALRATTYRN